MSFLLDTNVISEGRKLRGDVNVKRWLTSVPRGSLYVSVLTIGEIRRGVVSLRRRDPTQATDLDAWLTALRTRYVDRLLPVTTEISEEWGRLNVPDPVPTVDGLLAATARVHGLTLVTRNTRDLARTGVRLLNPFEN